MFNFELIELLILPNDRNEFTSPNVLGNTAGLQEDSAAGSSTGPSSVEYFFMFVSLVPRTLTTRFRCRKKDRAHWRESSLLYPVERDLLKTSHKESTPNMERKKTPATVHRDVDFRASFQQHVADLDVPLARGDEQPGRPHARKSMNSANWKVWQNLEISAN